MKQKESITCPHCGYDNELTYYHEDDLREVGKTVIICDQCNKLISIRDDGDGLYVNSNRQ